MYTLRVQEHFLTLTGGHSPMLPLAAPLATDEYAVRQTCDLTLVAYCCPQLIAASYYAVL